MAGLEDLLGLLSVGAPQKAAIQASDPYLQFKQAPDAISQLLINPQVSANPNFSLKDKIVAGLITGGLSGIMGGLSNDYENRATNAYADVLNAFSQGQQPTSSDVLDPGLFNMAKSQANIFNLGQKLRAQDLQDEIALTGMKSRANAIGELSARSEMNDLLQAKKPDGIVIGTTKTNPLQSSEGSIADKINFYFKKFQAEGQPDSQASISARQQVQGELEASKKTFDEAKSARDYGQKMLDLVSTARAGMAQAGKTGNFQSLRHAADYILSPFSDEANKKLTGDAMLSSIAPQLVQMSRSPGAVSDYETQMYLGSGPNVNQTPETNAELAAKMEDLAKLNLDYADFLDTYREINGNTTGAQKKWSEYRQAFPLFKKVGDKIVSLSNRPSWQDYFNSVGSQTATTSPTNANVKIDTGLPPGAVPTGKTSKGKPVYLVNGQLWVND